MVSWMTYVFDIGARLNGDHVTMLDPEVVADNAVNPGAPIVELFISKHDEDSIAPLLSADKDGVAAEELEILHGSLGQGNDRVVIVRGISNPVLLILVSGVGMGNGAGMENTNISWLGFFFFLRMAVETSFSS